MNKIRIKELESLSKEASQKIVYLEDYVEGRQICDVMNEHKLIQMNKQVVVNCKRLIETLK